MSPAESQATTATQLTRIAWLSARDPQKTFDSLMHHFNEMSLKACFHQLDGAKAVGADGVIDNTNLPRIISFPEGVPRPWERRLFISVNRPNRLFTEKKLNSVEEMVRIVAKVFPFSAALIPF